MLSVGVFMLARHIPDHFGEKLLRWAGEGVLAVYLLHMALIHLVSNFLPSENCSFVLCVAVTCLICVACILVQKIVKRISWLNWLFRI